MQGVGSACGSRTSRPAAARVTPRVVSPVSSLLRTEACRYLLARFYAIRITCGPNRSLDPRPPGGDDQGQVQVCGPCHLGDTCEKLGTVVLAFARLS